MDGKRVVREISFSESKALDRLTLVLGIIGGLIAGMDLLRHKYFLNTLYFSLALTLFIPLSSIFPYILSKYRETIIYEDGFTYTLTPFNKYHVDFSEVYDMEVNGKKRKIHFEMINVEDKTIRIRAVKKAKFDYISKNVVKTWMDYRGIKTR